MRAIHRKLLRDLLAMKGQALAISIVIAGGVATFISSRSTLTSLAATQRGFYEESRFADVFCALKRAPETMRERIAEIEGVDQVDTRVVAAIKLEVPGFEDPVSGRLVSLPDDGPPRLHRLYLRAGRMVEPGGDDEVVVSEAFAHAHGLRPGDRLGAIINGRRQALTMVGIGLSPEFIYQIRPGDVFPDHARYAILWMCRRPLAAAYDMEGGFNDLILTLQRGASEREVMARLDHLMEPYGGLGAYSRSDQLSNRYLSEEIRQLRALATLFPAIFLAVAAFLLHVVMERLVATQREQLAALKAFGYRGREIAWHYLQLALCVVTAGSVAGIALGAWLGRALSVVYADFFSFPYLRYVLSAATVAAALAVSTTAAVAGAYRAVRKASRLPPAEAMRPEAPPVFRKTLVERAGLGRRMTEPTRMILRQVERRALKTTLSTIGIAFSVGIVMIGTFNQDAIDFLVDVQFNLTQRSDVDVSFHEPVSGRALYEIAAIPGVASVEPYRLVPARLRFGHRSHRTAVLGLPRDGELRRLVDDRLERVELPEEGIVLTDYLAAMLGLLPGDTLQMEVLEGERPTRSVPVVGLVDELVGVSGYMSIDALRRLMHEDDATSGVNLSIDRAAPVTDVYDELERRPRVAGVTVRRASIDALYDTLGDTILIYTFINTLLAASIAFGVVYNAARISLAERSRELASLRVLGFTRGEIAYVLLGELALLTLVAIPIGFAIGHLLCGMMSTSLQSELYRIPPIVTRRAYALAAAVILGSSVASAGIVWARLRDLDLIAVLKTRE